MAPTSVLHAVSSVLHIHCNTLQHRLGSHVAAAICVSHYSENQQTATHCNAFSRAATHYNTLSHTATHCNTMAMTVTHCNTLQHNTLQHSATHCNTLQHTATLCNALQHTATHCNKRKSRKIRKIRRGKKRSRKTQKKKRDCGSEKTRREEGSELYSMATTNPPVDKFSVFWRFELRCIQVSNACFWIANCLRSSSSWSFFCSAMLSFFSSLIRWISCSIIRC